MSLPTVYDDTIEKMFQAMPLDPDPTLVFIGTAIDATNGEIFDQVVCAEFTKCANGLIKLAREMERQSIDALAMRQQLMNQAYFNGRYGSPKGGLVAHIAPGACGNNKSRFYIAAKTTR